MLNIKDFNLHIWLGLWWYSDYYYTGDSGFWNPQVEGRFVLIVVFCLQEFVGVLNPKRFGIEIFVGVLNPKSFGIPIFWVRQYRSYQLGHK
jgi:hypothetical protein